jgi:hypothetical protein
LDARLQGSAALGAVTADLKARDEDVEATILFNLLLQLLKAVADKFGNPAAAQAGHVNVVASQPALVVVAFAVDVHQVEFVDQAMALEQAQRAVDRAAVDAGVEFLRLAENLGGVEMLAGGFHDAEDGAALLGHPDAAFGKVGLQAAGNFGLR